MFWKRLGVITDEVSQDLLEALDWTVDQGLAHVEIRMVDGMNILSLSDEQVERVHREVTRRGLFVSAVSSPLFKCSLDPSRPMKTGDQFGNEETDVETHHEMVHRAIRIAKMLNTKFIRIFSFWREQEPDKYTDDIVSHLSKAAQVAEQEGIILLLENEHSCNGGYASEVATIVRRVNSPALKALWDPGNEERWSPSYPQGYDLVKEIIAHFHLKYWYVAKGAEPLHSQLKALRRDGYEGLYTLETHYIPEGGTAMEGTTLLLNMLRERMNEFDLS